MEEEDLSLYQTNASDVALASGVGFNELVKTQELITDSGASYSDELQAGGILSKIEKTDLFEQAISGSKCVPIVSLI